MCGGYCWCSTGGGCKGGSAWAERRCLGVRSCDRLMLSEEFSEYRLGRPGKVKTTSGFDEAKLIFTV